MQHKFLLCLFAVIALLMTPAAINAQENMYVWKADGSVDTFIVSELDSISFYLPECSSGIGAFSVSATRKVAFSSGNLQYNAASGSHLCADGTIKQGSWRFAEHQWDIIGMGFGQTDKSKDCYIGGTVVNGDNRSVDSTYSGWIDLFAWGTSGWESGAIAYKPYSTSKTYSDYYPGGNYENHLTGEYANADWGVYNQIGTDKPGSWRTMTKDEWVYLLEKRAGARNKYCAAKVNGVTGVVFLPDEWTLPAACSFTEGMTNAGSSADWSKVNSTNIYTMEQWQQMEKAGAVFLPCAGYRGGTTVGGVGMLGRYWPSTAAGVKDAYNLLFGSHYIYTGAGYNRNDARSVRLVREL